jgi:hypothetical protein
MKAKNFKIFFEEKFGIIVVFNDLVEGIFRDFCKVRGFHIRSFY